MSAKTKAPESIQDWQALHQQWWASLLEGAKQFTPAPGFKAGAFNPGSFNPAESLKGFGDVFGNKLGSQNEAAVERFLAGSKQFLQWVEGLSAQIAARGGTPAKVDDWAALFKQSAGPMFEGQNPFLHLFQGLSSDGARGLEQFMAGMPNPAEAFKGELRGMLGTPAFGFNREQQERTQQFALTQMAYQEAMAAYNAQMLRASKLSFEKLELKLAEREEPGRQLESLRAVYDLWIDAAEDAYAEVALSADFRTAYGNLVNQQMRLRQHLQAEAERQTAQFGMPTRSEINSVHKTLQQMRRRIRELEDRLDGSSDATAKSAAPAAVVAAARTPTVRKTKPAPAAVAKRAAAVTKSKTAKPAAVAKRKASAKSTTKKTAAARRSLNRLA